MKQYFEDKADSHIEFLDFGKTGSNGKETFIK